MTLRRSKPQPAEVNLTPLIDVVFLLLIFFMVSTTFTKETQLAIQLPEAEGKPPSGIRNVVEITITEAGEFAINSQLLSDNKRATLQEVLKDLSQGDSETPIIISGDANAPYQAIITAMDVAKIMGFTKIQLTTQQLKTGT